MLHPQVEVLYPLVGMASPIRKMVYPHEKMVSPLGEAAILCGKRSLPWGIFITPFRGTIFSGGFTMLLCGIFVIR
jgi:hypothetical protein